MRGRFWEAAPFVLGVVESVVMGPLREPEAGDELPGTEAS